MKKIDTSSISTTSGMPVKSGVVNHLQQSYQEIFAALVNQQIGQQYDPSQVYILFGCVNSGSGSSYVISAGAIFFNGEVYLVDAVSFTISGSNVAVGNIVQTFATSAAGDPVQFTDGVSRNVLQINKATLVAALTGTGTLTDFLDWIPVNSPTLEVEIASAFGTGVVVNFTQDQSIFFTAGLTSGSATISWDFTGAVPGTVVRLKVVMSGGTTLTFDNPAGSQIINESGSGTAGDTNIIYCMYTGVNEAGNHEVSYKVISF